MEEEDVCTRWIEFWSKHPLLPFASKRGRGGVITVQVYKCPVNIKTVPVNSLNSSTHGNTSTLRIKLDLYASGVSSLMYVACFPRSSTSNTRARATMVWYYYFTAADHNQLIRDIAMLTRSCDKLSAVLWGVAHAALFRQQWCQRLTANGSRFVCKCRVVKHSSSSITVASCVPRREPVF